MAEQQSTTGRFFTELGILVGVVVALICTILDIVFGIFRYLYGRVIKRRPNFNPWAELWKYMWRPFILHYKILYSEVFVPALRDSIQENRKHMHERAIRARETYRRTRDLSAFDELDFEYLDAGTICVILWSVLVYGWLAIMVVQAIAAMITVISLYGVYHYYNPTATERTAPQQKTVVKYEPQVADKQETDFGPTWLNRGQVLDKVNDPSFKNVAMLADGSMKYSETKVVTPTGFTELAFSERVINPSVTATGQVQFQDQLGNEYTVNKGQGFIFESYGSKAFMFNGNGKLMAIKPEDAKFQ